MRKKTSLHQAMRREGSCAGLRMVGRVGWRWDNEEIGVTSEGGDRGGAGTGTGKDCS